MSHLLAEENQFGKIRSLLFPIHTHELKRFIPMALMMLFILFNYTILRNIKDSLVVNAKGSDADIISFLKLWGTTPSAILFMILYTKLSNVFNKERIFYMCITPFIIFFGLFAFIIYPHVDILHPSTEWVAQLKENFPRIKWFITMWGNWSFAAFYILAELWGSVVLSLLFWQLANDITSKMEAKRFYSLFGFVGNIGLVLAGYSVEHFSSIKALPGIDPMQVTLKYLMGAVVISGAIILGLYYWLNHKALDKPVSQISATQGKNKKSKPKLSMLESFKYLLTSPHILCIAILVFSYGISINFIDVLWKGQVKLYTNGDHNAFAAYMGKFSKTTGFIALPLMLIGGNILRRLTWLQAACIVPIMLLVTGSAFFGIVIYGNAQDMTAPVLTLFGMALTPVALAVQFGFWQNSLTKASKYSLFDPTKEMAYIPLDDELKTKGKSAVDVAGGRLGKSGGSLTFFILQTIFPAATVVSLTPYLGAVFAVILVIWFSTLFKLSRSLKTLEEPKAQVPLEELEKVAA